MRGQAVRLCGSRNTRSGRPCRLPAGSCPYPHHRLPDVVSGAGLLQPQYASLNVLDASALLGQMADTGGMAGQPDEFELLLTTAGESTGITRPDLVRDYYLSRALHRLSSSTDATGRLFREQKSSALSMSVCAFGGETSLVSAWQISSRYSQDLDLVCMMSADASKHAKKRMHSRVWRTAADACNASKADVVFLPAGKERFQSVLVPAGKSGIVLKVESTIEEADETLLAPRSVVSLMGRHATADQIARFPELGGFIVPCVVPAYTAANKFDALHRRSNDPEQIATRARDVYDLCQIACSDHAEEVRRRLPALAQRAADTTLRPVVPRPGGGYKNSPAFLHGNDANTALRQAYDWFAATTASVVPPPPFVEAVEWAVSLDAE